MPLRDRSRSVEGGGHSVVYTYMERPDGACTDADIVILIPRLNNLGTRHNNVLVWE